MWVSFVGFCENSSNRGKAITNGKLHVQTAQHQHVGAATEIHLLTLKQCLFSFFFSSLCLQ